MRRCQLRNGILVTGLVVATLAAGTVLADDAVVPSAFEAPVAAPKPSPTSASNSTDAVLLKYRFTPNQTVHFKVTQKMSVHSQKGMAQQTAQSEWTTYKHMKIVEVTPEGIASAETTIDRIVSKLQFDNDKPKHFDSDSDDEPPGPLVEACRTIGKPRAIMKYSTDGTLIGTELVEHKAAGEKPPTEEETKQASNGTSFLVVVPKTPIKVGDSWKDPHTVNVSVSRTLEMPITIGRTYTLKAIENDVAVIGLESSILTPVNNQEIMAQLISLTPSGTIRFDMQKGLIVSKSFTSDETVYEFAGAGSKMRAENSVTESVVEHPIVATRPKAAIGPSPAN